MAVTAPSGQVVSVLNMKGGVGKTTISAHVIRVLYRRRQKKVLLIDLDPQFNLTQALITRTAYDNLKSQNRTIFTAMEPPPSVGLFDVAVTTQPPPPPTDIALRLRRFAHDMAFLDLIPGNFELVKYNLIDDRAKMTHVQQRFLRFVSLSKSVYDLIVIDCNPSSSFITLCALHACTKLLVPVRPDRSSVLGLELVADFLERLPTITPKPAISILLNGIPTQGYTPAPRTHCEHTTLSALWY